MIAEPERPALSYIKEHMTPDTWGGQLRRVKGLEVLEFEFETEWSKKDQLESVVARAKYWLFPLSDGSVLEWTGLQTNSTWVGLRFLKDDGQMMLRESPISRHARKREYQVITMTWRASAATRVFA